MSAQHLLVLASVVVDQYEDVIGPFGVLFVSVELLECSVFPMAVGVEVTD